MNSLPLLTATLLVTTAAGVLAVDQCEPNCFGHDAGDWVEDPMNCTQFYVCLPGGIPSDHAVPCESGHFDPTEANCVPGDECEATCKPVACHLTCSAAFDLVSHPSNCSIYYVCDASLNPAQELPCPSNRPFFNGKNCNSDETQCCTVQCEPYCHAGDVQIPDPYDCRKYYICLEEGPAEEGIHYQCDSGENFNIGSGMCEEGAPCVTLCGDTPTTTTTTTTTTIPGTTRDCVTSFTCPDSGYYPKCHSCQPGYFKCSASGASGVPASCSAGYVFNTNPNDQRCILPSDCPYSPSL